MLTEVELRTKLQSYAQNKFILSADDNLSEILPDMLAHIGSIDSLLRDDLIYSAFATWILHESAIGEEQLRNLLPIILDEQHLLYRIGEQGTDSVFTRSFSMLVLPLLLIAHRSRTLFLPSEIQRIKEGLLYYLENERDRRGFVPEKGWAHAIAHAADALDDLAQCAELKRFDLTEILDAIRQVVCVRSECYCHAEEERLVTAVLAVLRRDLLPDLEVAQWISSFSDLTVTVDTAPEKHLIRTNVKNFLQSLYFRLQWEQVTNKYDSSIHQALRKISPFVRDEGG